MQGMDWNDLRYLLAVHRTGTYTAAARILGVDDTTVSRRLKSLERSVDAELFHRLADATLTLSQAGHAIVRHAENMEFETEAIGQALGEEARKVVGTVRVTSVPIVVNRILVPAIAPLLEEHPHLSVETVPDARDFSLTRREADIAIRLARPVSGGGRVKARRIGTLSYGAFAAAGIETRDAGALGWIRYDDTMAHLPQSKWIDRFTGSEKDTPAKAAVSGIRVSDAETALEAAACGLGMALLPMGAGQRDPRLQMLEQIGTPPLPEREVWLLSHTEQRNLKSVRTVIEWIETLAWSDGSSH